MRAMRPIYLTHFQKGRASKISSTPATIRPNFPSISATPAVTSTIPPKISRSSSGSDLHHSRNLKNRGANRLRFHWLDLRRPAGHRERYRAIDPAGGFALIELAKSGRIFDHARIRHTPGQDGMIAVVQDAILQFVFQGFNRRRHILKALAVLEEQHIDVLIEFPSEIIDAPPVKSDCRNAIFLRQCGDFGGNKLIIDRRAWSFDEMAFPDPLRIRRPVLFLALL